MVYFNSQVPTSVIKAYSAQVHLKNCLKTILRWREMRATQTEDDTIKNMDSVVSCGVYCDFEDFASVYNIYPPQDYDYKTLTLDELEKRLHRVIDGIKNINISNRDDVELVETKLIEALRTFYDNKE